MPPRKCRFNIDAEIYYLLYLFNSNTEHISGLIEDEQGWRRSSFVKVTYFVLLMSEQILMLTIPELDQVQFLLCELVHPTKNSEKLVV